MKTTAPLSKCNFPSIPGWDSDFASPCLVQCIWFTRFTNALFHQWQNQSSFPGTWFILFHYLPTLQNLKFLQLFPMLLCFSSDLKSFTVTLHSRQPNCVQTPRPTLCWIPAYGSSGFSKSSFPATLLQNSILHVYSGQENWNLRRTSINFSNWVCRFIYKTNPPLLWDRWMGTALRNSSKKIEASWSKCLHEIKWYFGIQFCLLYWKLWPAKKIIWQKSFTPYTCYFSIISSLLHNQKIFCILFSHCIGDTTLQIGAIYEIWTIDK